MYTIMIKADNTCVVTSKEVIMARSKLTSSMQVVTPKYYNDYDMTTFDLVLSYMTPLSKSVRIATMALETESYDGVADMLCYKFDIDTGITAENGDVKFQFMFVKTELDPDTGANIQRVRMIDPIMIHVCQITDIYQNTDQALSDLAEIYLRNQQIALSLSETEDRIYQNSIADVAIDADHIRLKNASGTSVGTGISLEDLNDELVEIGSQTSGNVNIINI